MNRLFNPDNPVMSFLAKMFDLVLLNLIFILSCIPVITIGASLSALSYVSLKMVRAEEPYIIQNFFKSFRQNFRQGTVLWLLCIVIAAFLGMDFYIINSQDTSLFAVVRTLLWVVCAFLLSVWIYLFPVISHFVCTTKQAVKNACLMSVGHLPYTVVFLAAIAGIAFLCSHSSKTFALVVIISGICGFSAMSFSFCLGFDRIFKRYEPAQESDGS